jgi:HSP20 family protein
MISVTLKPDSQRPGYFLHEDLPNLPESSHMRVTFRPHAWRPPTDVFETSREYIVRVEIAGMQDTDFTIVLDGRYLSIRGVRSDLPEKRAYHQMEIRYGEFISEVEVPGAVSVKEIEAYYNNGFLHVRLPKARPVKIQIEEEG